LNEDLIFDDSAVLSPEPDTAAKSKEESETGDSEDVDEFIQCGEDFGETGSENSENISPLMKQRTSCGTALRSRQSGIASSAKGMPFTAGKTGAYTTVTLTARGPFLFGHPQYRKKPGRPH